MSVTWKLRKWVEDNRTRLYMGGLAPYEVGTIADEIDAEHKRLADKAHADGEKSAMKQVRSKSVDYKKGYEQAMNDVEERTKTEQSGSQTVDLLMELLNEYYESECAIDEDRVTYYADRLDGRTEDERMDERTRTEQNGAERSKVRAGSRITDELRVYVNTIAKEKINEIADRIDWRYTEDMFEECEEDDLEAFEATHVKLPVDADGEVIHIGDEMDVEHFGTVEVEGFVHNSIAFYNYTGQPAHICTSPAALCRHHHEPTVEDVLRELIHRYDELRLGPNAFDPFELLTEYAAKLRLAGEDK